MSNITEQDRNNLEGLRLVLKQNPLFGVNTDPNNDEDLNLYNSMLRLEEQGLVIRRFENEFGIWWQAKGISNAINKENV